MYCAAYATDICVYFEVFLCVHSLNIKYLSNYTNQSHNIYSLHIFTVYLLRSGLVSFCTEIYFIGLIYILFLFLYFYYVASYILS